MGRVITATTMSSNRQASRNPGKTEYGEGEDVSPTSSNFSKPGSAMTEIRDCPQTAEQDTTSMAPKKYCCSNSAQSESKIWAIFDIVTACLVLIVQIYFTFTLKADRQLLQSIVDSNKDNERDLNRFLQYSHLFLFIPKMAFTQNKFLYVSGMIAYFLYKWYEVWIVTVLFRQIRQEEANGKLVGDVHRTLETERNGDKDKPPDIGTISSGVGQLVRSVNPGGKTFPTQFNYTGMGNVGYSGMDTPTCYSRMSAAGRDNVPGGFASHMRGYDTVGRGSVGWEPDPMGSTSTFVLAQPPKRLKFQSRPADLSMLEGKIPAEVEHFRSSKY
ncbi:unnamed protein product [Allacma fusca]|uniref:Uncharacterized protein n=1 Tax=Allacma fusca TaxID=39272 RepID=A0A8J2JDL8_9HEXA|nr:unnamed protein product [Allacma fusca]